VTAACDCDVLIIGGGPTGVTLAALLVKRGVSVIVAEKEADIYPLPRAAHIDHEGMRILQEAGVAEAVMATSRRAGHTPGGVSDAEAARRARAFKAKQAAMGQPISFTEAVAAVDRNLDQAPE
jgi:2-polyprenyl-6-methoxyphenol hydroxylase-like FAD-dependent oxidoreductase